MKPEAPVMKMICLSNNKEKVTKTLGCRLVRKLRYSLDIMKCPACHSSSLSALFLNSPFLRCNECGHAVRTVHPAPTVMVNSKLSLESTIAPDGLTSWMVSTVRRFIRTKKFLVDIGCGTGKFLYHAKDLFDEVFGIEVSAECVTFIHDQLHISVGSGLPTGELSNKQITAVTAWHAVEHLRFEDARRLFIEIASRSSDDMALIIAVPNGDSFFGRYAPKLFAFYDETEHYHQFSVTSLEGLLRSSGYESFEYVRSMPYSIFAVIQSGVNTLTGSHNYLYYRLKRAQFSGDKGISAALKLGSHLIAAGISGIILSPILLLELIFPKKASSIVIVASKR